MAVEIRDIEDSNQLLHFAAIAQLEQMKKSGWTLERVAEWMPKWHDRRNFARKLREDPSDDVLQLLDELLLSHDPEDLDKTGGLSALAMRLRRINSENALQAYVPPSWWRQVLELPMINEIDVLRGGSILLRKMHVVRENAKSVRERNANFVQEVVTRLILIGASPPTPHNVEALIMLGSIAGEASTFGVVERTLEGALSNHPLGFRVWRAVTTVVKVNEEDSAAAEVIKPWVQAQLHEAEYRRADSLFPARSLDLELAIAVPLSWSPPDDDDWVAEALRRRIVNPAATVRERGTAAHGLWERALKHKDPDCLADTENYLRTIVDKFRQDATAIGLSSGLHWVATTLEQNLNKRQVVTAGWPDTDQAALRIVKEATATFAYPTTPQNIVAASKTLFEHALLQNAGVPRRHAIDTLAAGSWTGPVVKALDYVITHRDAETWLRCRALFALSFLQDSERTVEQIMRRACERAKRWLDDDLRRSSEPSPAVAADMHAALFAIGDCFGAAGAEDGARRLRRPAPGIDDILDDLLKISSKTETLYRVGRAAAYVVAVTAQTGDNSRTLLSRTLAEHHDEGTTRLCEWALKRFTKDGVTRPIHEAF
jgi:hypothetical protein